MAGDDPSRKTRLPAHLASLFEDALPERAQRAIQSVLDAEAEGLTSGRLRRAVSLSRLAIGGGGRVLLARARDALLAREPTAASGRRATELAGDMLQTFAQMRGLTMKLGQMLSYLDDAFPPEARRVLTLLQRDVSPMPWPAARAQIIRDLGRAPEVLFSAIDETPFAAASVGQVHRAVLPDGTPVAVKVQYPGIDEAMAADLKNARVASMLQRFLFFRTDTAAILAELEARFMDECDYRKEAEYQEAYRARFAGHPWIVVPEVHPEFSGRHVLTTTWKAGRSFYEWLASDPSAEARARTTRLFYRFYLGSFYLDGLFNCDPHPGNYLFQDDGRIVFLDYGCSRRFPDERRRLWIQFCGAVPRDDAAEIRRLAIELGFFSQDVDYDADAFRVLMRYLYEPYLEDVPFDFRAHRPVDTFRRMFVDNPNLFKLNMPADAVFLNRIGFGLVSLLAEVGSTLNCRRYADAYFSGVDPDWPDDPRQKGMTAPPGPLVVP